MSTLHHLRTNLSSSSRVLLESYGSYKEAQFAIDKLADARFPVEHTAIVAEDLSFVEQVTGRLNWWRATLAGASGGIVIGVFVGLLFGVLSLVDPLVTTLVMIFWGAILGAVMGGFIGLVGYLMTNGQRDFNSVAGFQAARYNVLVDADRLEEARNTLMKGNT